MSVATPTSVTSGDHLSRLDSPSANGSITSFDGASGNASINSAMNPFAPSILTSVTTTTATTGNNSPTAAGGKKAPPPPPAAVLLRAINLEEAALAVQISGFFVPKAQRKPITRHYRAADQLVVFVAVGEIIVLRAVVASDVIPRCLAAKNIPEVESCMPSHWCNIFRFTNAVLLTPRGAQLGFPCPVNDRSELPSMVDSVCYISRAWLSTVSSFVDATHSIAVGKVDHYDDILRRVDVALETTAVSDLTVPDDVRDLVSVVKMVSHAPGIVVLGYLARVFGKAGREFLKDLLFQLNSGVIDLCRHTMGGALISYLVRNGTCATPRILQMVPWRVVATRVLSDPVGSQTASLMLHSAIQMHRRSHRSIEPVAMTSLTHKVLTRNFADATDPSSDCPISTIAANGQSCRVLQLVVEASVELLAMHSAGQFETARDTIDSAERLIGSLCDVADKHAADPWSNYATQSLISACSVKAGAEDTSPLGVSKGQYFDRLLDRVMAVVKPSLVRLSCHKCGSNVIEKLCAARPKSTQQVADALLAQAGALPRLASDRFGNYVVQTLLRHLPSQLEGPVREALLPVLRTLDPNWHCTIAIDSWCKRVAARIPPSPPHSLEGDRRSSTTIGSPLSVGGSTASRLPSFAMPTVGASRSPSHVAPAMGIRPFHNLAGQKSSPPMPGLVVGTNNMGLGLPVADGPPTPVDQSMLRSPPMQQSGAVGEPPQALGGVTIPLRTPAAVHRGAPLPIG